MESEGKQEWRRGGVLLYPDVTDKGKTDYRNSWIKGKGRDTISAWDEAYRLLRNYYKGVSTLPDDWTGIYMDMAQQAEHHHIPSQDVRTFCKKRVTFLTEARLSDSLHAPLTMHAIRHEQSDVKALLLEFKSVYNCWKSYKKNPAAFVEHITVQAMARTREESREYWADPDRVCGNPVATQKEIWDEILFYESAFCTCTHYDKNVEVYSNDKWRDTDGKGNVIDYLPYKGDCVRSRIHGFCGHALAAGAWDGSFAFPMSFLNNQLGTNVEKSFRGRYGTTPEKEKHCNGKKSRNKKRKHGKDVVG